MPLLVQHPESRRYRASGEEVPSRLSPVINGTPNSIPDQWNPLPFVDQHRSCGLSEDFWGGSQEAGYCFIVETKHRCCALLCSGSLAHRLWTINADCGRTRRQGLAPT